MAKINGTCSGSSAAKYDLWLDVIQNSQDIENNKSNITVKLKLKRNDGYSSSAYNSNESDNSAAININGTTKDSNTLKIDTRNGVTVVLAEWTENVSHNDDGSLTLNLSGSFTMGNTSLTGGKVSGSFTCTNIPRASKLTIVDSSVTPGGSFKFSISGVSSFKHIITCQISSKKQSKEIAAGTASGSFTIPTEWAEYVTDEKKTAITVVLATYKSNKLIGSKRYSITFIIPDTEDYKPTFELSLAESGAPDTWNVYLKGISKLTVTLSNQNFKAKATLKSISIKFDGSTKRANNSVFEMLNAGDKELVVRLTDSRGYYTEVKETINVKEYFPPSIKIKSVSRCDENGFTTSDGTYLLVNYTSRFCDVIVDEEALNVANIRYSIRKKGATTTLEEGEITQNSPVIIGDGSILSQSGYEIVMAISDVLTNDDDTFHLGTAGIPFNIKKGGNGAAFGCYAENDNELRVAWDLNVLGKISYENVPISFPEFIGEYRAKIRYYSCLDLVFLRLRLKPTETLIAGKDYVVAVVGGKPTELFTPFNIRINYTNGRVATGGIGYSTGEIIIRADEDIVPGDKIYISGMYLADYEEK
ncbi:MAG: DUF859 family phage minor structural protein [Acutalibacteraceae bacterium]